MNTPAKTIADLLPAVGFFGVYFLFGREMLLATWGLVAGILIQLLIYYLYKIPRPKWLLWLAGIALVLATLTLIFKDSGFIQIRPTIVGLAFSGIILGSILIDKNIFKAILGKAIKLPDRAWNIVAVLWSVPLIVNALLNLVIANVLPWPNFGFSEETWVFYRLVGGFVVTAVCLALTIGYVVITKQHRNILVDVDQEMLER